jgi:uncharacterized damage-inducible protein DinB
LREARARPAAKTKTFEAQSKGGSKGRLKHLSNTDPLLPLFLSGFKGFALESRAMNNLNATLIRDFSRYYEEARDKIHALLEPLSDEHIWTKPFAYGNSIGHLLLHLTGNLSYYIGAEIAHTGYVRNRPLEFTDTTHHPKAMLLQNFDAAISMVLATLQKQAESDWSAPYTAKGMEDAGDRFTVFLRCAWHIAHHTGQMMYLCKQLAISK